MSFYCHNTPGRLRIKTPIIKQNMAEIDKIRNLLLSISEIESFTINPVTGSIVIKYDACEGDSEAILNVLKREGYYRVPQIKEDARVMEEAVTKVGKAVGKALVGVFVEKAFEGTMFSYLSLIL